MLLRVISWIVLSLLREGIRNAKVRQPYLFARDSRAAGFQLVAAWSTGFGSSGQRRRGHCEANADAERTRSTKPSPINLAWN